MPSKAYLSGKTRLATNRLARTLQASFSAQPDVRSAAVLGNKLIAVGGTLYDSTVAGSEAGKAISVVNIGRPAAAVYAPSSGGVMTVGQSSGGSSAGSPSFGVAIAFSNLTGTIGDAQAPQFLKTDGTRALTGNMAIDPLITIDSMDPDVHMADPNAHHYRLHDIFSTLDHSYTGAAALNVVGYTGAALGWLVPSSNPGAATAILKSDTAGNLALTSLTTNLINSASGNLTLDPMGDVIFPNAQIVRTNTFSSSFPIGGFELYPTAISGQSGLTIGVIEADELRVRVFVADETRVDRGEKYDSKSFGILSADFTTPSSLGGTVRIYFEDSPALTGAIFSDNDWLLFRVVDITSGLTVSNIWGQVSSYINETGDFQSWLFTLRQGTTNYLIKKSRFAVDWGASGQGLIHYSAVDPTGAPYIEFLTWAGSNPYTPANWKTHVRVGKLVTSLDNDLLPTGYGLYGDNVFLSGSLLTGGGDIRIYQASGINIQEDVTGSYVGQRALQWWPDVTIVSGTPSLTLYTGKDVTSSQNQTFMAAHPTGGVSASVSIAAWHQGSGTDAQILMDGGSSALPRSSLIQLFADSISLHGALSADLITANGLLPSNVSTPNDIGTNANRFDTIYADNIVANTLTAAVTSGSTLSGNIWQNDASNMTIESDSSSNRILFVSNAGTGTMSLYVDNDIVVGGNVDGVDVSALYTSYSTHSHLHSTLSGLTADDHINYVHISAFRTITAQPSFSPTTARAPFVLGANAQSQLITGLRADQLNKQVIAGSGLSGTGTLTADVTLALAWGTPTISTVTPDVSSSAGTAITPTRSDHVHAITAASPSVNLAVATANAEGSSTAFARSDHAHAITSSAAPGASASLLASTSAGGLTLVTMTLAGSGLVLSSASGTVSMADNVDTVHKFGKTALGHASYTGFAAFSHRSMSAVGQYGILHDPAGVLYLNATTGNSIFHRVNNADVMQMTVQRLNPAGSTQIDLGDYNRKWRTLYATELYVEVLVAQSVMATIGGRILVAPTTKLIADVNAFQTTIDVKDSNLFDADFVHLETNPGGTPQVETMRIISTPTSITGGWRYSVMRKVDTPPIMYLIASMTSGQTTLDTNSNLPAVGQYIYFPTNSSPTSLGTPPVETIQIVSGPSTITGGFRYTITRNINGTGAFAWGINTYGYLTTRSWLSGDAVVSMAGGSGVITTLIAAMTTGATTIDVGSSGLVNGANYFFFTAAQYEPIKVISGPTTIAGGYRYTVTRNLYGSGAKAWTSGSSLLAESQQIGRGYIDLTSTSTVHNHLGPTIAIYSRTGTANWNDVAPVVSFGNLRSFVDYTADTFGWAVGNDLTLSPTGGFSGMTGDAVGGLRLFNVVQKMYLGGTEFLRIDATNGIEILASTGGQAPLNAYTFTSTMGGTPWAGLYSFENPSVIRQVRLEIDTATMPSILTLSSWSRTATQTSSVSLDATSGPSGATAATLVLQANESTGLTSVTIFGTIDHTSGNLTSRGTYSRFGATSGGELYITNAYGSYAGVSSQAEISNDISTWNQLMLLGNTAGGGGIRRVGVWDQLSIAGAAFNMALNIAGGVFMVNASTPGTPSGGGYLYVNAGALWFKGSSGSNTKLANA